MDERLERHLCNLHNEVFEAAESRINTECSLTIREGISRPQSNRYKQPVFPHYTWGYIVQRHNHPTPPTVPSLYVRVYRLRLDETQTKSSSLTIREGISSVKNTDLLAVLFPHYTWGYIDWEESTVSGLKVPSLYVRVYRKISTFQRIKTGSLTIREGISWHTLFH